MPKIVKCEVKLLTRPHVVLTTSYGATKQERRHAIVILYSEDGKVGYGEATPLSKFTGETTEIVVNILENVILPAIVGIDCFDIARAHIIMDNAIAENHAAKCAVDCALHDLASKELGIPLYQMLGGKCRDSVSINRHIGIMDNVQAVSLAKDFVSQGFMSIKMKVGGNVQSNISRVRAVREAVGDDAKIRIDANAGYNYTQASEFVKGVYDCNVEYYEQLLPKWDIDQTVALHKNFGIPILLDEAVNTPEQAVRYAVSGAADAFTIKLCKCGGLYRAKQIAGIAEAFGMGIVVASTYDTHIGCGACLHLATALPNIQSACDLTTYASQKDIAKSCHVLNGMQLHAGDSYGIGVFSMNDFGMTVNNA